MSIALLHLAEYQIADQWKGKMTSRSTLSNFMLVPSKRSSNNIAGNMQRLKSYTTALESPASQQQPAGMFTQLDSGPDQHKHRIEQSMEFPKGISPNSELHAAREQAQLYCGHSNKRSGDAGR